MILFAFIHGLFCSLVHRFVCVHSCFEFPVSDSKGPFACAKAACVAGGRIGGILSPLIFEQCVLAFGGTLAG